MGNLHMKTWWGIGFMDTSLLEDELKIRRNAFTEQHELTKLAVENLEQE